jgi:hypothetical protein
MCHIFCMHQFYVMIFIILTLTTNNKIAVPWCIEKLRIMNGRVSFVSKTHERIETHMQTSIEKLTETFLKKTTMTGTPEQREQSGGA